MSVIRRTAAERRKALLRAATVANVRWVVFVRRDGDNEIQGAHSCPSEALASARDLRRAGFSAWTRRAGDFV
jgi:hypothetical protein